MRLLVMATGAFAVPMFKSLLDSEHRVVAFVTRPPVAGRGDAVTSPSRAVAERHGIPILEPPDINDPAAGALLDEFQADLFVVCDFGQILAPQTLARARLGGINLHGSLLPKYRGAAPVQWAVFHGDTETGVTVIHMTPRLDAGPCLVVCRTPIGEDEDAAALEARLAELGVVAVRQALELLSAWDGVQPLGTPQNSRLASRAPRLRKQDGAVDWSRTARQIRHQVRAFKPWPGTHTAWEGKAGPPLRLILDQVAVVTDEPAAAPPGTVLRAEPHGLWVATGGGVLAIERLQPAGKRVLTASEFLRGYPLRAGQTLG